MKINADTTAHIDQIAAAIRDAPQEDLAAFQAGVAKFCISLVERGIPIRHLHGLAHGIVAEVLLALEDKR